MPAPAPRKKRIRDPERTRQKLLDAAVELVAEKGPEALSLKEVAIRADVSRSVTYVHFKDRDHLLAEAKAWISDRLREGVQQFDDGTPAFERIVFTTKLVLDNPEVTRAMMIDALTTGELNARHPLFKLIRRRLKEQQKSGRLSTNKDLEILAYIHLGTIASTLLLQSVHKGDDTDKLARRFAREWCDILEPGMKYKR